MTFITRAGKHMPLDAADHDHNLRVSHRLAGVLTVSGDRVLELADEALLLEVVAAATITVPPDGTATYPIGSMIHVCRAGAGDVRIAAGSGVTLRRPLGTLAMIDRQHDTVTLLKTAPNTWRLIGALRTA